MLPLLKMLLLTCWYLAGIMFTRFFMVVQRVSMLTLANSGVHKLLQPETQKRPKLTKKKHHKKIVQTSWAQETKLTLPNKIGPNLTLGNTDPIKPRVELRLMNVKSIGHFLQLTWFWCYRKHPKLTKIRSVCHLVTMDTYTKFCANPPSLHLIIDFIISSLIHWMLNTFNVTDVLFSLLLVSQANRPPAKLNLLTCQVKHNPEEKRSFDLISRKSSPLSLPFSFSFYVSSHALSIFLFP